MEKKKVAKKMSKTDAGIRASIKAWDKEHPVKPLKK
jgi:hypothetical protein